MRRLMLSLGFVTLTAACGMQDATTPVPQPDSLILGRLAAIREVAGESGVREVELNAGLPEQMQGEMRQQRRFIPELERDVVVHVRVTDQTVCVANMRAEDLDVFRVGQEVAVVPVGGSSAMVGSKLLLADAAEFYLFSSYQLRFLARSLPSLPAEVYEPSDPARVNSAGMEITPLPLAEGRVVYFAAGLLPPLDFGKATRPVGAERPGMRDKTGALAGWAVGGYRPYRTAWNGSRWEPPLPVVFADVPSDASARVTWINDEETACLVDVRKADGVGQLFASQRANARAIWGKLEGVALAVGASVGDAQRFGQQKQALVWTVYDANGSDLWLSLGGKPGQSLDPRINTLGPEYAPRVGPNNVLYFCRGDRQLLFAGGVVQEVRLPGAQRRPLLEAVPTKSGTRLFFRVPRYTPGQVDWNLAVAGRAGTVWGKPVLLDDWKPM